MRTHLKSGLSPMQRSVLILILSLTVILLLTAVIFENPPIAPEVASVDKGRSQFPESADREVERYVTLGRAYLERGDLDRSLNNFQKAHLRGRNQPQVLQGLGMVYVAMGEYARAEDAFRALTTQLPTDVSARCNLAVTLMLQDRDEDALAVAQDGLAIVGDEIPGPLYLVMAAAYANAGRVDESQEALGKAHHELGANIVHFTNASWAVALKKLPLYAKILEESGPVQDHSDLGDSELMPDLAQ